MRLVVLLVAAALLLPHGNALAAGEDRVSPAAVIHELNLARQNPAAYARFLDDMRSSFSGNVRNTAGRVPLLTHEGMRALDEATEFLRKAPPEPPLALSPGLCQAAADHCRDQTGGSMGHTGHGRSNPGSRISRYGAWQRGWAENIAYGQHSAREIVLALIIDDGVPSRAHRRNVFNSTYAVAGAAYGPHARFGSVCGIDFAGGYFESGVASAQRQSASAVQPNARPVFPGEFSRE
ncbi:MAG: CAP domain-containing protein [Chthoniobacterales bacterium]